MKQRAKMFNGLFEMGGAVLLSTVVTFDSNSMVDDLYVVKTKYDNILKCESNRAILDESVIREYTFLEEVKISNPQLNRYGLKLLNNVCVEDEYGYKTD